MEINYEFVPEYESSERKMKSDIISYAGKLLEIVEANTLVVGLDNAYSGNTEKKPPGDGHPSGAYFVLTWKYLLSWLSLVYARAFFLSS